MNRISGRISEIIGGLIDLKEFHVNGNDVVGLVHEGLTRLNNRMFMGPVPKVFML
ncbi:hypothetical protein HanIR_Chr05g0253621 [Helianthus annuus]|nr:hypothetical protein HanIR_Chr05g0253621 [Helianthus annuus]